MDAFYLLQQDHRAVSSLMDRIKAHTGETGTSRLVMYQQVKAALELHARVEELHVYPVFQQAEVTRNDAAKALEDHRRVKTRLDELAGMPQTDFRWVRTFNELHKAVVDHMTMEEQELFGHAGEVLTRQEAEELGTKVESAKKALHGEAPAPAGGIPD